MVFPKLCALVIRHSFAYSTKLKLVVDARPKPRVSGDNINPMGRVSQFVLDSNVGNNSLFIVALSLFNVEGGNALFNLRTSPRFSSKCSQRVTNRVMANVPGFFWHKRTCGLRKCPDRVHKKNEKECVSKSGNQRRWDTFHEFWSSVGTPHWG